MPLMEYESMVSSITGSSHHQSQSCDVMAHTLWKSTLWAIHMIMAADIPIGNTVLRIFSIMSFILLPGADTFRGAGCLVLS